MFFGDTGAMLASGVATVQEVQEVRLLGPRWARLVSLKTTTLLSMTRQRFAAFGAGERRVARFEETLPRVLERADPRGRARRGRAAELLPADGPPARLAARQHPAIVNSARNAHLLPPKCGESVSE